MKKTLQISSMLCLLCSFGAWADSFTVADFVGKDKFCTQLFYSSEMISDTPRPQEGAWGRFEAVEGSDNKVRLTSFKNGGSVTFTIDGDHLLLDGTESKDGAPTTDANGNAVKLVTVKHSTNSYYEGGWVWKPKHDYHFFIKESSNYVGNIERNEDESIKVTFYDDSFSLQFRSRTNIFDTSASVATCWNDVINTFRKVELHIQKQNGDMLGEEGESGIPLVVSGDAVESSAVLIGNFCGTGKNYFNNSTDGYTIVSGVNSEISNNHSIFKIPSQAITGQLTNLSYDSHPDSKTNRGFYLSNFSVSNTYVEGNEGTIEYVGYEATPGWHKKYVGGEFEIREMYRATSDWGTYSEDQNGNHTEIYPVQTREIKMWRDLTPDVTLSISTCLYNEGAILVEGDLYDEVNPELVDSYDVFVIGNRYDSPSSEAFDSTLDSGHKSAVCITDGQGATLRSGDRLHFSRIVPMEEVEAHGWNPNATTDGYMTVYARLNLHDMTAGTAAPDDTTETDTPEAAPRREAPASLYSFSALTPTPQTLATSTELLTAENVTIGATKGAIEITGNSGNVTVYDAAGQTIYRGTDNRIAVTPGLYIVTTPTRTAKILVR